MTVPIELISSMERFGHPIETRLEGFLFEQLMPERSGEMSYACTAPAPNSYRNKRFDLVYDTFAFGITVGKHYAEYSILIKNDGHWEHLRGGNSFEKVYAAYCEIINSIGIVLERSMSD